MGGEFMDPEVMDPEHVGPHSDVDYDAEEAVVKGSNEDTAEGVNQFLHGHATRMKRSSPYHTYLAITALTINFVMVPGFFSGMGWALAVIVLCWAWSHSFITGLMLDKVCEDKPQILSYPDLGAYVAAKLTKGSKHGRLAGYWTTWAAQALGTYLVSVASMAFCAQFLQAIFPQPCYSWWIVIAYGVTIVLTQIPTFHETIGINLLSMSCFTALFILILVNMGITGPVENVSYSLGNADAILNGISGFSFAFGGHSVFLEARREMKRPEKFKYSIYGMYATLGFSMSVIGYTGYGLWGDQAQINILSNFDWNASITVGNVFMLMAFLAPLVIGNILTMMCIQTVLKIPLLGWRKPQKYGMPAGVTRTIFRVTLVTTELILALLIPFISDLVSLTGALSTTFLTFMFPCIAYWTIFNKRMTIYAKLGCALLIGLSFVVGFTGLYAAISGLISNASKFAPFHLPCSYLDL
ncbi:hypothetical protein NDN08_005983 [Rhodosorus marinus]|uniref:Amino acid transporter transmembrane domain-containing protein n=1 Tax=Rhodosorus marinus TaxID=101924 RepID=A0AAV8UNK1_9RHOD|nr:hypothetical protein NDN08_005983 [Rhodosorus marinus]